MLRNRGIVSFRDCVERSDGGWPPTGIGWLLDVVAVVSVTELEDDERRSKYLDGRFRLEDGPSSFVEPPSSSVFRDGGV